ncbi:MAG TPA: hypothetical protein V6C81_02645 [Planktothrix sp.]|jgi:hypothetical protein
MSFIGFGIVGFGVTFLSMFMTGLGLMDGKPRQHGDSYYTQRAFYVSGTLAALFALYVAGLAGAAGALVGAAATWLVLVRGR